ncbi:g2131 [Coccomyxa elongata]
MRQRTLEPEMMGPTTRTARVMAAFGPCSTSLEQKAAQRLLSEKQEERKRLGLKEVHGVFPNEWVAKKLNEWFGPPDPNPTSPPIY